MKEGTFGRLAAICLAGIFLVALPGCRDERRDAAVADFARLYVQLRLASSESAGRPEEAREHRERVLRAAGLDLVAYRQRLRELQADPDRWDDFWERVRQMADSLERQPKKKGI